MKRNIIIISLTIIAMSVIGFYYYYHTNRSQHIDIDTQLYPIKGIDISAHNGIVDFNQIAKSGIQFVYIKATEGATFKDSCFHSNYRKARKSGLKVGAYHFFKFNTDGGLQALNIIHSIKGKYLDLPIAIDIEEYANDKNAPTDSVLSQISAFTNTLNINHLPFLFYTNKNGYSRFIKNHFEKYPLWICSFSNPPIDAKWTFWQHSHKGTVKGISGNTDLNIFNGTNKDWEEWLNTNHSQSQ